MHENPLPGGSAGNEHTIACILARRARTTADRLAYAFVHEGEIVDTLTYRQLDDKARAIAARVQANGTTRPVLLLHPSGLDFVAAFFGCLHAGVVAVPLYPPGRRRQDARIAAIMADAGPELALTCSSALRQVQDFTARQPGGSALQCIATDALRQEIPVPKQAPVPHDATAYLQYTSGSTSTPKGVVVSHQGLLRTLDDLDRGWRHDADSAMVSWLPLFHDMGLIYGMLQPMHGGFPCYLMDPMAFLQRPLRWLEAITRHGGTHSAAPNFAFDLCVRGIGEAERKTLDLSRWRVALNAAEPVRPETLAAFSEAFGPAGFDPLALCPGYGLAESTLKVTAVRRGVGPTLLNVRVGPLSRARVEEAARGETDMRTLVGCGVSEIGARIAIVDTASGTECGADSVGEIWVRSDSVGLGYWQRPEESGHTFGARLVPSGEGPFLRTGDLGFQRHGELFITGRVKDLVIVRGVNHYPQDIELTVERSHAALTAGAGAAFAIDVDGDERLVVVHELSRKALRHAETDDVVRAIRAAVAQAHDLAVHAIALLRPATIPKTSSGKIQRSACRSGFEAGSLNAVAQWHERQAGVPQAGPAGAASSSGPSGAIGRWIVERVAERSGASPSAIDTAAPFAALGIDSLAAVRLSDELGRWLGRALSPTLLFEYPTPDALSRHLEQPEAATGDAWTAAGQRTPAEPIAVIGIGCRFPGGPDVETFWQSLAHGFDSVAPPPAERRAAGAAAAPPGHFLEAIDRFDAEFFGIAPREAESMDPQQRLLLEVACDAIEDAGLVELAGSRTGVFVGISTSDYARLLLPAGGRPDAYAGTGGAFSIAANRLSYLLDLRGPSWAVDTACSSSLVAVHQAAQALRLGECELALAGGVNVIASPELTMALAQARMLSPDGRCKTFDASADGYGRGEGCGVVVLKRYRDALRDGDRVAALLLGTAVNQDGRSNGLTAPNGLAQRAVIRDALADAGVAPADVGHVEAHGTGTPLGDPIEVSALQAALSDGRTGDMPCRISSVKTAIGHLEAAAGIAGLIKTVLALEHEALPPHLHLQQPNPRLALEGTPFSIPTALVPWPRGARRRIAGVSSFGFGGTNAHVVVAEAPAEQAPAADAGADRAPHLLALSAKTPQALADLARRWSGRLARRDGLRLAEACATANVRRTHHRWRIALVADDPDDLQRQLTACADDPAESAVQAGTAGPLVMLFTGQGAQHPGMGLALYRAEPAFREVVDTCDALLRGRQSPSLHDAWLGGADERLIHETAYTQPALYVLEVALAHLWRSWGVEPAALLGHSIGEYAAAAVAGVFSVEDGLKLVAARGRLMQALPRDGLMAVVAADQARVLEALGADHPQVSIAAVNGPRNTVISGARAAVEALVHRFTHAGIGTTALRTSHAFHSPLVEPMLDEFAAVVADVRLQLPRIPLVSNVTGEVAGEEIATPAYWRRHVRQPVLYAAGVTALVRHGCRSFLEVGPAPVLLGMARQAMTDESCAWLPSLRPGVADERQMLDSLAAWHVRGGTVDWRAFHRARPGRCIRLPTYPFQRQRYWLPDARPVPTTAPTAAIEPDMYRVAWQSAGPLDVPAARTAAAASAGCWLLLADPGGIGEALAGALERLGHRCLRLGRDALADAPDPQALRARVEDFTQTCGLPLHGAVHLLCAEAGADPHASPAATRVESEALAAIALLRLLAGQPDERPPARLWLVTRAAVPAQEAPLRLRLAGAALWGLGRGLAVEQPRHWGGLVDLDAVSHADDADRLLAQFWSPDREPEIAWRADGRRVPRLVRPAALPQAAPPLRAEACYLVTGGCGFVGLEVAAWLLLHGARQIVLANRGAPSASADARLTALRARGADVRVVRADVAEPAGVAQLFDAIEGAGMHPLRGIVHAAGVGEPRAFAALDARDLASALRPKLAGTCLLDARTEGLALDFFVVVSSIASVWGGKDLAHYAAANHVLDAWAHDRHARGLPASAINCGPWAGGGMAAGGDRLGLAHSGIGALAPDRYLDALSRLIASGECQAVVAQVDWQVLRPLHEARGRGRLFDGLGIAPPVAGGPTAAATGDAMRPVLAERLRAAPPAERRPLLVAHVRREVAAVLGLVAGRPIDSGEGFFQLGMDSLMAVDLRNRLATALGRALPAAIVFDFPTIDTLAATLLADVEAASPFPIPLPVPAMSPPAPRAPVPTDAAGEPIAIVGIGCRFPGDANDARTFWELQREGRDAIRRVPADRWDADAIYDPDGRAPGTAYTRHGGFIDDVDRFDAPYFGISPREAAEMDPQHRLILEVSHAALEDAGHAFHPDARTPDRTGVFLGVTHSDYAQMLLADGIGPYYVTGSSPNAAAGRVSYALRLKGPSLAVDTACSSSLVAVDLACRSLRGRECDAALAGGVNLILAPTGTIAACQARMLSPDGRCKTFDASADGYGRGEGAGVVVLKRLSDAVASGDRVWAVILGSAVNQDGRSSGFTVPSGPAQQAVIRGALAAAGVQPEEIGYVEAHGTGTALGDPIEAGALGAVFADGRRDAGPLPVGSVKANIGHLESAAGIAGLIRAALVVHHGEIPRLPGLAAPNPEIDWRGLALHPVGQSLPWPGAMGGAGRRIAGVSSFGVSGTNAHALVAEPPARAVANGAPPRAAHLLALSARTPTALRELAGGLLRHLEDHPELALEDLCYTLNGRMRHAVRAAWRVACVADARSLLRACADATDAETVSEQPRVAWVFDDAATLPLPARAIRALYETEPAFRAALDRLASSGSTTLPELLAGDSDDAHADPARRTAKAFALQYALAHTWRAWGATPELLLAHGSGAWAAACAGGALDAAQALQQCLRHAADTACTAAMQACATATIRCVCTAGGDGAGQALAETVARAQAGGIGLFLEIGIERSTRIDAARGQGVRWLPASAPQGSAWEGLVDALAGLHVAGADIDLRGPDRGQARRVVSLPTYPLQRRRYWFDDRPERAGRAPAPADGHPLLGRRLRSAVAGDTIEYAATLTPRRLPFLGEHRVLGTPVLPSSAYLEMVLAAAADTLGEGPVSVLDYRIGQPGLLNGPQGRELHLVLRGASENAPRHAFDIVGIDEAGTGAGAFTWTRHAEGQVQLQLQLRPEVPSATPSLEALRARVRRPADVAAFYSLLQRHGIDIGVRFHALRQLWAEDGEALGEIVLPDGMHTAECFRADPVVLDACFQIAGAALATLPGALRPHLQVGIDRFTLLEPCGPRAWAHARLRPPPASGPGSLVADLRIYSPDGTPIAIVDGLRLRPAGAATADESLDAERLVYGIEWPERPLPVAAATASPPAEHLAEALAALRRDWLERPMFADYAAASAAIDALCGRLAAQALAALGWPQAGEPLALDATMQGLGVAPRFRQLMQRLLDMRARSPQADEDFAALRRRHPGAGAEIALLERTAPHLADVLRGTVDPHELLFPGGSLDLLTRLYEASPVAALMNALVARVVSTQVAAWPAGRPLRVLEIGAGTGATTAAILPHLPVDRTEYVFTDVDDRFTKAAAQRFAACPFVRCERLNIEQDPAGQGIAIGRYDIVIAANVLHATSRLERSLAHARRLLAPGGLLVLLEGTAPLRLFDLTFGLTEGWWRFAGDPARPAYPLVHVDQWHALLAAQGLGDFGHAVSDDPRWPALPSQAVMTARAAPEHAAPSEAGHWLLYADRGGMAERLAARLMSHGETVALVAPSDPSAASVEACRADVRRACAQHGRPLRGIVHLASLDAVLDEDADAAAMDDTLRSACRSALALTQALVDAGVGRSTTVHLVTRGAVAAGAGDAPLRSPAGLAQAPVWGLGKVLASEHAELSCRLIDLDPGSDEVAPLFDEIWHQDGTDEARVALRAGRRHVARLAARLADPRAAGTPARVLADRTYLVTGGFGGIGLHVAQWLAAQGARHLVLLGRRGTPPQEAAEPLRALQAGGVRVISMQADVSDPQALSGVLDRIAAEGPPLGGVVHAAGVFADRLLVDQDWMRFEQVFAPKIHGAWNLHRLTRRLPLDFFVLCSSASTLFGGAGLANYVAANEFLDALAAHRHGLGLPGLSINWGPWSGVGMARHVGNTREAEWHAMGLDPLTPASALHGFGKVLGGHAAQAAVMRVDWQRFVAHPLGALVSRFVEQVSPSQAARKDPRGSSAREAILGMPAGERARRMLEFVRSQVEAVLAWPAGEHIGTRQGFFDLGMDSLQANELRNRLQAALDCTLPSTLMFRFPTTAALAAHLHGQLCGLDGPPEANDNGPEAPAAEPAPTNAMSALQQELQQLEQLLGSRTAAPSGRHDPQAARTPTTVMGEIRTS